MSQMPIRGILIRGALTGAAMAALFAVSACTTSQYPGILQVTMAQALPPYHMTDSAQK